MRAFLFLILSCLYISPVFAEPLFNTYLGKNGDLLVSYKMQSYNSDDFFEHITDNLKSGKEIQVVHKVSLKQGKIFSITIAEAEKVFNLSYDLLQSTYRYNKQGYSVLGDENLVKQEILSLSELPLPVKNKLVTGDEYRIEVKISTRKVEDKKIQETWRKLLGKIQFPSLTQKNIKYEVPYIAR